MSHSDNEISYREFVQRYLKTNELSPEDYDALETYRAYLKLLPAQARRIEQEVLGSPTHSQAANSIELESAQPAYDQSHSTVSNAKAPPSQSQSHLDPNQFDLNQFLSLSNSPTRKLEGSPPPPLSSTQPDPTANVVEPAMDTTMIPPKPPEQYFAHRQQYGQEFLSALRSEGFNLGDETRERLRKLAIQLELLSSDVADIERTMLVEVYLTDQTRVEPPSNPEPPPSLEEKYDPNLRPLFDELEGSLKAKEFRGADVATFEILLKVIRPTQDWLDEVSLRGFSASSTRDKNAIQEIDRLWDEYSDGNFGFSQQLQLYSFGAIPSNDKDLDRERREHRVLALAFSRSAQWWIDGLEFFKYYNQLDFTTEAPKGHLPGLWFWRIPRLKAFQYGGLGLLKERGGCRVDAYTLPAFMYVLKKCGIKPR
jgi:hypothetical protein